MRKRSKAQNRAIHAKKGGKKKPFGGYSISFKGRKDTMESVYGKRPISPMTMTKLTWKFVKLKNLGKKG